MVCFIDEDDIMSYVDFVYGITLHPEASVKVLHIKW